MLSIGVLGGLASQYFTSLTQEEYYTRGGEPPGRWWGKAAEKLGFAGKVNEEHLDLALRGYSSAGEPLVQNAGDDRRRPGFDFTFSAPKSVSALWAVAPEELRQKIEAAHNAAVDVALKYLQAEASRCRTGAGGVTSHRAEFVAALFNHCTSRALEPQIHTHALVMNLGISEDETHALDHPLLFAHKMATGAIYRAELAVLIQDLGFFLNRDRFAFEVCGVPHSLTDEWSTRHKQIAELLGKREVDSAIAAAAACLESRDPKTVVPPRTELFQEWVKTAIEHQFTPELISQLRHDLPQILRDKNQDAVVNLAINHITSQVSHFRKQDLVEKAAMWAQTLGVGASGVLQAVENAIVRQDRIVELEGNRLTTKEILNIEQEMIANSKNVNRQSNQGVDFATLEKAMRRFEPPLKVIAQQQRFGKENDSAIEDRQRSFAEQMAAVRYLTGKGGGIRILEGVAGSGKTSTLRMAREVLEKGGYTVIGATVANRAARELKNRAGIESMSVAKLLYQLDDSFATKWKHHLHMIGREALKKPTYKFAPKIQLSERTVLVIDEASMLDTRMLAKIVEHAAKTGAMLILVGDRQQLQSIGPGGSFAHLADQLGKAELTINVRQREAADRAVAENVLKGESEKVIRSLYERGRFTVSENHDSAVRRLVNDWFEYERGGFQKAMIFCATRTGVDTLNAACQHKRAAEGNIDHTKAVETVFVDPKTGVERAARFHPGDRVMMHKNSSFLDVDNGDMGTVVKLGKMGSLPVITVQLDRGGEVRIPVGDYKHMSLGYATTVNKGQGMTTGRGYIFMEGELQNRQMTYVQMTRGVFGSRVYATKNDVGPEFEDLVSRMRQSSEKTLATAAEQVEHAYAQNYARSL